MQVEPEPDSPVEGTRAARMERRHSNPLSRLSADREGEAPALDRSQSGPGPGLWGAVREGRTLEQDAGTASSIRSKRDRRFALISPPPAVSRSAAESVQNTLRNNTLLSPFVGGTPNVGPPPLLHAESMESVLDDTARPDEMYRWIQETAYRQADAQALHTVIYLRCACQRVSEIERAGGGGGDRVELEFLHVLVGVEGDKRGGVCMDNVEECMDTRVYSVCARMCVQVCACVHVCMCHVWDLSSPDVVVRV